MPQQPEQHVEHDHRPRIADMGEVVDRRPAHIHAHVLRDRAGGTPASRVTAYRRAASPSHRSPVLAVILTAVRPALPARTPNATPKRRLGLLARRPCVSMRSKDGRSQRRSLARNLPANAADVVEAVHARENGELDPVRQGEKARFGARIAAPPRRRAVRRPGKTQIRTAVWLPRPRQSAPNAVNQCIRRRRGAPGMRLNALKEALSGFPYIFGLFPGFGAIEGLMSMRYVFAALVFAAALGGSVERSGREAHLHHCQQRRRLRHRPLPRQRRELRRRGGDRVLPGARLHRRRRPSARSITTRSPAPCRPPTARRPATNSSPSSACATVPFRPHGSSALLPPHRRCTEQRSSAIVPGRARGLLRTAAAARRRGPMHVDSQFRIGP